VAKDFNMDDPATNLLTMIKFRADTSGADCIFAITGEAWAMIPDEGNHRLFKTFGIGATHAEEVPEGWRIYSKEVLYFLDPDTGEILREWDNPFIKRKVDVVHIANDPVNGVFLREGEGPFGKILTAPYPYVAYGDNIIFQWNFYIMHKSPMPKKEYPLYSQSDFIQHAELWGIQGKKSEATNPAVTSAQSTISWSRVDQWQPWMEMGDRPGFMVFHTHCYKVTGGVRDLPRQYVDYTKKHYPQHLESPKVWESKFVDLHSLFKQLVDSGKRKR